MVFSKLTNALKLLKVLKTVPQTQDRPDSKLTLDTNGVSKIVLGINFNRDSETD